MIRINLVRTSELTLPLVRPLELTPLLVQSSGLTPPLVQPLELTPPLVQSSVFTRHLVRIDSKIEQTKITTMLILNAPCFVETPFAV